jgi:hypothetical protein
VSFSLKFRSALSNNLVATFDLTAEFVFSESLQQLENNVYSWWPAFILENLKLGVWIGALSRAIGKPWNDYILKFITFPVKQKLLDHHNYAAKMVDRRMERDVTTKPDMWSFIQKANEQGNLSTLDMHHVSAQPQKIFVHFELTEYLKELLGHNAGKAVIPNVSSDPVNTYTYTPDRQDRKLHLLRSLGYSFIYLYTLKPTRN